jgi:hypothetical protein
LGTNLNFTNNFDEKKIFYFTTNEKDYINITINIINPTNFSHVIFEIKKYGFSFDLPYTLEADYKKSSVFDKYNFFQNTYSITITSKNVVEGFIGFKIYQQHYDLLDTSKIINYCKIEKKSASKECTSNLNNVFVLYEKLKDSEKEDITDISSFYYVDYNKDIFICGLIICAVCCCLPLIVSVTITFIIVLIIYLKNRSKSYQQLK